MFDSLWLPGLQHARPSCPPLSPGVCSSSCLWSWWCCLTILSSASHFSFCLQSFPESGSLPVSWFFTSGGQSIGSSTSASVLPMSIQGWFPLGLTCYLEYHKSHREWNTLRDVRDLPRSAHRPDNSPSDAMRFQRFLGAHMPSGKKRRKKGREGKFEKLSIYSTPPTTK